jgi:hypothetical protein
MLNGNSQKITTRRATSFPRSGTRRYTQVRASDKSTGISAGMTSAGAWELCGMG